MTDRDLFKQALYALEKYNAAPTHYHGLIDHDDIIAALRERLAQYEATDRLAQSNRELDRLIEIDRELGLWKEQEQELKPCRSPYCECERGKCTHQGFYDARHEPARQEREAIDLDALGIPHGRAFEPARQEQEFIKHEVENPGDWTEWVCPDPKSYLMKCCDCGLVHEVQFGVVRYASETEREECEPVDDPNLQAVFRVRRSEEWTPEDAAYRPGGLPARQEPVRQQPRSDYRDWDYQDLIDSEPSRQDQCPVADRFEAMHARGDLWITTLAAAALARNTAPQPVQQPLTDEQKKEMFCKQPNDVQFFSVFDAVVRLVEAAHGITGEQK